MSVSGQLSHFLHWKWNKQCLLLLLGAVSALSIVACWRDTQHKHCIYCCDSVRLSETNSETHNTSAAFTVTYWKWNKQCLLSGVPALNIIVCWRDTQYKHCIYCRDSLKVEQTVLIYIAINWVECLHIAACWRDTRYKHCSIYCNSSKVEQTVFVITIEWSIYT